MTTTENIKAEMIRQADWLNAKSEQAREDACDMANAGCFEDAEARIEDAVRMARKARTIREAAAL